MVTLIGSTITWFAARPSKPCQRSPGFSAHCPRSSVGLSRIASGCQTSNHQEPCSCSPTPFMARRKLSASSIVSWTRARPAGCSIMAAATSQEAMMAYCGDVDVCIMKASLKRVMSSWRVSALQDVHHGRLRERGEKLVRRVGGEGDRVRRPGGMGGRDGVVAVVELVEVRVGEPRFVEVQNLDRVAERSLDLVDVVAKPVIGRVGHDHEADLAARLPGKRARRDFCAD